MSDEEEWSRLQVELKLRGARASNEAVSGVRTRNAVATDACL